MQLWRESRTPWGRRHVDPRAAEVMAVSAAAASLRSLHPDTALHPAGTPGESPVIIPHILALNPHMAGKGEATLMVSVSPHGCRRLLLCPSCVTTPDTGRLESTAVASNHPLQAAKVGTTSNQPHGEKQPG